MRRIAVAGLLLLIFVNFIYVLSGTLHLSFRSIDVFGIWMYKAKVFYYHDGRIIESILALKQGHPEYPVLLPFAFYLVYKFIGGVNEMVILFLYPLLYSLILFIAYKTIRKIGLGPILSLLLVYLYSIFGPLLGQGGRYHAGSADIWITLINWIIIYMGLVFHKDNKRTYIPVIIALLIAVSSQIKTEGIFYLPILFFLPISLKRKLVLILVAVIPAIVWRYLMNIHGLPLSFSPAIPESSLIIPKVVLVGFYIIREFLNINNWYVFWPIFFLLIFTINLRENFLKKIIGPSMLLTFMLFYGVFFVSVVSPMDHVPSAMDRILLQMSPMFYLYFANLFQSHLLSYKFKNKLN